MQPIIWLDTGDFHQNVLAVLIVALIRSPTQFVNGHKCFSVHPTVSKIMLNFFKAKIILPKNVKQLQFSNNAP
jgi:hypothetical protein